MIIRRSSPSRVLYCESSADGTIGGSHYCLLYLLEHLDRSRFDPVVVFYESHKLLPRFQAVAETIVHPQDHPVQWGRSILLAPVARAVNFARFLGAVWGHIAFLLRHRIDLVHLNNSITRHQDWVLATLVAGIPCIVHERGLSNAYTVRDRVYAGLVDLIIPMSAWIRDHMIDRGVPGDNIRVMYDGLDPAKVQVTTPAESVRAAWHVAPTARVIGIVGNIRPWKGQQTVVEAVIAVTKHFPDLVCFFVGATTPADEAYLARMKARLAEAGAEQNVRFTGYQPDVSNFINMMEFLVHASIEPEPFGMVVLEGMAQRKAVIGSRAGGPVEMILEGETGYTVPPGDPSALAARMIDLLVDPDRCRRMGLRGYERLINEFTMARYMENIHGTYRAILEERPVPATIGLRASDRRQAHHPA